MAAAAHLTEGGPQRQHDAHAYLVERIYWSPNGHVRYRSEVKTRSGGFSFGHWIASANDIEVGELKGRFGQGDLAGPARVHVHRVINKQLREHVSPVVRAFLEHPVMRNFPDSLLNAIYFRFALDLVSPDSRESICDYCHQPYAQGRRDKGLLLKAVQGERPLPPDYEHEPGVRGPSEDETARAFMTSSA